jgi:hypothetical protein
LVVGGFELGELTRESLVILVPVFDEFLDSREVGKEFGESFGKIVFTKSFFPIYEAGEVVEVSFNCFFLLVSGSLFEEESKSLLGRKRVLWVDGSGFSNNRAFVVGGCCRGWLF